MKKNRPGTLLTVLCTEATTDIFSEMILRETPTFGIRKTITERRKLHRIFADVKTTHGTVSVKIGTLNGKVLHVVPEFASVKKLAEELQIIENAENILRDLGFRNIRVRHHSLQQQALARIELATTEIPNILADENYTTIATQLKNIGYTHVTLDLQGYRRGSMNELF